MSPESQVRVALQCILYNIEIERYVMRKQKVTDTNFMTPICLILLFNYILDNELP